MPTKKPTYSRANLEAVIDNGGSVIHRGQLIMTKDQLPTEADLLAAHLGQAREEVQDAPRTQPLPERDIDEEGNDPLIGTDAGIQRDRAIEAQAPIVEGKKSGKTAPGDPTGTSPAS